MLGVLCQLHSAVSANFPRAKLLVEYCSSALARLRTGCNSVALCSVIGNVQKGLTIGRGNDDAVMTRTFDQLWCLERYTSPSSRRQTFEIGNRATVARARVNINSTNDVSHDYEPAGVAGKYHAVWRKTVRIIDCDYYLEASPPSNPHWPLLVETVLS